MKAIEINLSYITLRGLSNHNTGAPLLLCLHGWLDNSASFLPLTPFLQEYHVVVIDLPGHGLSDHRSADAYYHFSDWLSDLHALITHQKWSNITLVGHSMGGMIACAYSASFPEHVKQLVLFDSMGFITTNEEETCTQLRQGLLSRTKAPKKAKYFPSIDLAVQARLHVSDLQYEHAELIIKRNVQESPQGYSWRYDKKLQLISPYRFSKKQADNLLANITCRCLFIGSESELIKSAIFDFSPLFKNISCYHLVGGHHVHMEKPLQVSKILRNFLN